MRCKGGKFGCTPSRESVSVYKHGTSWTFDFPASNTCQREKGLRNGKAEAPPVLRFVVALFRIFGKATRGLLKIRKLTKWPTGGGAFSDQGERKLPVAPT